MLSDEFRNERAKTVRALAEKVIDPFIKNRLLNLAERYDVTRPPARAGTTPIDLQFTCQGNGAER